jgi:hypothetical protein
MIAALLLALAEPAAPLLTPAETRLIAAEVSGSAAKRTVQALSLHHRMRGSEGYRAAAALIRDRLDAYGLEEVDVISLPADGRIFYGTQRSRPAWNATFAELWEERRQSGGWADAERVASWADQPISLAQDSASGAAEGELIDVGAGTSPADYAGKEVKGKIVLTSSQPGAVAHEAVTLRGAAGIVSWAQNQKSGWWGDDQSLIRWGHLDTWDDPTWAFMVSPARAHAWQARLAKGESIRLRARVEAGRSPGAYLIPTAVIAGRDRAHEIVLSCHLDHPSPGANDNASGCAGILEVARGLRRLIAEGKLPRPKRTIRFVWPCEVECTIALLNAKPEFARRTLATIHLDMIGGNTDITHGTLKVEGSPPSLPSFVSDVGFAIGRWVDEQSRLYADHGAADYPLTEPDGTKNALHAKIGGFTEGSDHQVWAEGSWRVPVIYIADWPDIYIHTQKDVPANLDSTKIRRAVFIAATSAWALANLGQEHADQLASLLQAEIEESEPAGTRRVWTLGTAESVNLLNQNRQAEADVRRSGERFGIALPQLVWWEVSTRDPPAVSVVRGSQSAIVYRRKAEPKGPMDGFGYSWLDDHLKQAGLKKPALLSRETSEDGPSFGYETLNLVDGRRTVGEIRDALAATVAPAPVEEVADYLATLETLGLLERVKP